MNKKIVFLGVLVVSLSFILNITLVGLANKSDPIEENNSDTYPFWDPPSWWLNPCSDSVFSKKIKNIKNNDNSYLRAMWTESTRVDVGDGIQFRISFTAEEDIDNLEITDHLPSTVLFMKSSIPYSSKTTEVFFDETTEKLYAFTKIKWDIGDLNNGDAVEILIKGRVEHLDKRYFGIEESQCPYPIEYVTRNVAVQEYTGYQSGCNNPYHVDRNNDATFTLPHVANMEYKIIR